MRPANSLVFYLSAIRSDIDLKCIQDTYSVVLNFIKSLLPRPRGGCNVLFSPCLSVCLCVCLCVRLSVRPANSLVFYLSAIRSDIDLKCIQDTYSVVLNSIQNIDLHRSRSQGRLYHKT